MQESITLTSLKHEELLSMIEEGAAKALDRRFTSYKPQDSPIEDRIMNSIEAAKFLGVSRVSLHKWIKAKSVPFKRQGRRLLFSKRELISWTSQKGGSNGK